MVFGLTEAAQDISFGAMVEKQNLVTEIVKNDPTVASVTSAVGSGGGGSLNTGRMFILRRSLNFLGPNGTGRRITPTCCGSHFSKSCRIIPVPSAEVWKSSPGFLVLQPLLPRAGKPNLAKFSY